MEEIDKVEEMINGSSPAELIKTVSEVDPTRFWMVVMMALIFSLSATIIAGGKYLVKEIEKKELQVKERDSTIAQKDKEIKMCPEETIRRLKLEQETIKTLKTNIIEKNNSIDREINSVQKDVQKLEQFNKEKE